MLSNMTLVEAFLALQSPADDSAAQMTLDEAWSIVSSELDRLAMKLRIDDPNAHDVRVEMRQRVLIRLFTWVKNRRDGVRLSDAPQTDKAVRAFLFVSLRNTWMDLISERTPSAPAIEDLAEARLKAPADIDFTSTLEAYRAAEERVRNDYASSLTETLRNSLTELIEIAAGRTTVHGLVAPDITEGDRAGELKARNARYKRYQRALEALHQCVDESAELDEDSRSLHHRAVDDLKIRPAGGTD